MSTSTTLPAAIVLVDDEPDVRIILRGLMAYIADGYELVAVSRGAEALEALASRPVPLLITDYNMRGMSGLELTQTVKAAWPHTTVVLITAYVTSELEERSRVAGADYFVSKPFAFDQLEAIVREALG
jgi:two-component system, response regulator, stage 0 sporulation protein F